MYHAQVKLSDLISNETRQITRRAYSITYLLKALCGAPQT